MGVDVAFIFIGAGVFLAGVGLAWTLIRDGLPAPMVIHQRNLDSMNGRITVEVKHG